MNRKEVAVAVPSEFHLILCPVGVNPLDGYTPSVPSGKSLDFGSDEFIALEDKGQWFNPVPLVEERFVLQAWWKLVDRFLC